MIERLAFDRIGTQSWKDSCTGTLMNSSEDLIVRARGGDHEAFRLLFERYSKPMLSFIHDLVGERDLAEELTQETFVRAYHKLTELRDDTKFATWLFGIGRNVSREALRSRTTRPRASACEESSMLDWEAGGHSPADQLFGKELTSAVNAALRALDEDKRTVFILRIFQQRSYGEIMAITGFSLAKVKTDLHRARIEVRQRIRPYRESF